MDETYGSPIGAPLNNPPISPEEIPLDETYGSSLKLPVDKTSSFPIETSVDDTYGSSISTAVDENFVSPSEDVNSLPSSLPPSLKSEPITDNSIHDLRIPDKVHEVVIHPGGGDTKEHLDVHKVEILGAASVVQASSAQVPDQAHPEKYMNFDTDLLDKVVHHNLWYKDTKVFKHHKHGHKHKVIPHLHPAPRI